MTTETSANEIKPSKPNKRKQELMRADDSNKPADWLRPVMSTHRVVGQVCMTAASRMHVTEGATLIRLCHSRLTSFIFHSAFAL